MTRDYSKQNEDTNDGTLLGDDQVRFCPVEGADVAPRSPGWKYTDG